MIKDLREFVDTVNHEYEKPGTYMIIGFVMLLVAVVTITIPIAAIWVVILLWKFHYLAVAIPTGVVTISFILGYYTTKFVNRQP